MKWQPSKTSQKRLQTSDLSFSIQRPKTIQLILSCFSSTRTRMQTAQLGRVKRQQSFLLFGFGWNIDGQRRINWSVSGGLAGAKITVLTIQKTSKISGLRFSNRCPKTIQLFPCRAFPVPHRGRKSLDWEAQDASNLSFFSAMENNLSF